MDLSKISIVPPPPGVIQNFHDPESRATMGKVVSLIGFGLMVVFVMLRLYTRGRITRSMGWDDYVIIMTTVLAAANTAMTFAITTNGYGPHTWNVPVSMFTTSFFQKLLAYFGLYSITAYFVKLSFFLLYFRIFASNPVTRFWIYLGIAIISVFYSVSFSLVLYFCSPISGSYLAGFASRHCNVDNNNLSDAQAAFNMCSDLYLLAIPVTVVLNLQLPTKKKLGVIVIFVTGIFATICSILNLYYRHVVGHLNDASWNLIPVYITSNIEIDVGIICNCMLCLAPLFRHHKFSTGFSLRDIMERVRSKISGRPSTSREQLHDYDHASHEKRLETEILAGAGQNGKFMDSGVHPQRQWLRHGNRAAQSQTQPTITEMV